jgi:Fusaric acid resistance protein-like
VAERVAARRWAAGRLRLTSALGATVQSVLGCTIAWVAAERLADHPKPVFAPIAALIALNATYVDRTVTASQLLGGVFLGIAVGELMLVLSLNGTLALALAATVSVLVARLLSRELLVINETGASALITVATAGGAAGIERVVDALVGGAVALLLTLVVFLPEPVRLIRRAETAALRRLSNVLTHTAQAIGNRDADRGRRTVDECRLAQGELDDVRRVRKFGGKEVRRSLMWRWRRASFTNETAHADALDDMGDGCLLFVRTVLASPESASLEPMVRALAGALEDLGADPLDPIGRQRAVDAALGALRLLPTGIELDLRVLAAQNFVVALMVVLWEPQEEAQAAVTGGQNAAVTVPPARNATTLGSRPKLRRRT